ncbi:hypothetical protein CTI12_AA239830 [Artemisia annua]|uniref:Uncharacterized protein n=1 Tax=Artemisia annua TaxID=35608 RepID=A0A2U1NQK1_ARTAN|nr:hypothetical protein CTI12_AA239830 [Artemisia annua]
MAAVVRVFVAEVGDDDVSGGRRGGAVGFGETVEELFLEPGGFRRRWFTGFRHWFEVWRRIWNLIVRGFGLLGG